MSNLFAIKTEVNRFNNIIIIFTKQKLTLILEPQKCWNALDKKILHLLFLRFAIILLLSNDGIKVRPIQTRLKICIDAAVVLF